MTPLEQAALDAARALVTEVKEDSSTNEMFTRFLGYRDLHGALAALDAAPTQRGGACPRPHHLLMPDEVCPDCRAPTVEPAPVEEERCGECEGTGMLECDCPGKFCTGKKRCVNCQGTGKAKG
jgi:hypothetical protein